MKNASRFLWTPKDAGPNDPSRVGLIQLAGPILLETILRSTVSMVDVVFLSRVSDSVVSAVSVASQYIVLCQIITSAVATGTIVCINQALGMKDRRKVDELATIAIGANILLGLLFGLMFLLGAELLLGIMSLDAVGMRSAAVYMRICGGCMVLQSVQIVLNSLCRSLGRTRAPLAINLVSNLVNVCGNYLAVFHSELLGLEPVAGVAVASELSVTAGLLMACVIAHRAGLRPSVRYLRPFPKQDLKLCLSIGIPGGINNLSWTTGQLVTTSIISVTGTLMVATKVYVSDLVQYVALVGMSFSQACSLMVGYRIGAGNYEEADELRSLVTRTAVLSNIFFSLLLFCFRDPLMRIFTDNSTILSIAHDIFLIDILV